ncbi:MAG TPA: hypothetical protein VJA27_00685 [Patescibacteria group bacterium]|nr:hypothetical protein [Patescibacteria group bacterium]
MFDDQIDAKTVPPRNLPVEPDDMFAGVEQGEGALPVPENKIPDALSAGVLKRKEPVAEVMPTLPSSPAHNPPLETTYSMKTPILGKVIFVVLLLGILGGTAFGGWWVYRTYVAQSEDAVDLTDLITTPVDTTDSIPSPTDSQIPAPVVSPPATDIPSQIKNDVILFGEGVDTDKDGLDDIREQEIGTNPNHTDSDSDGLSDGDEVIVWKTNPLNEDSDGDTHADGKEVANGYNPLGAGKLVSPATSTSATSTK